MFIDAFNSLVNMGDPSTLFMGITSFVIFVLIYFAIIIGVIYVQVAERRLPIQYSNKTSTAYGAKQTYMPIKINSAGVIPVIFASTIVIVPSTIAGLINNESFTLFTQKYLTYDSIVGFSLYVLLIIFFAYFYTFMQLNPKDLSDRLTKSGGYIPGVRPGKQTIDYIKQVLSRLTIVGAAFLVVISALPILFSNLTSLPSSVKIGGTGLLIVVGVALESYKQLESNLVSRNYRGGRSRR
jgi:preprotein translocase subunit SecY